LGGGGQNLIQPIRWDIPSIIPALDGSVISVPEQARKAPYSAKAPNDFAVIGHTRGVRVPCIGVKVESVRVPCEEDCMGNEDTTGSTLRALVDRSGLGYREVAKAGGWTTASGIQRYVDENYTAMLRKEVAERFATALVGKGNPPIERQEVMLLTGLLVGIEPNATPVQFAGSAANRMERDLPIYGAALGAEKIVDGEAVELTTLNRAEIIEYRERPPILNGKKDVYGLYVQGSSMDPAFDDGDLLVVQKGVALSSGDFVVVYLRPRDDSDDGERATSVLVKRLVKRSAQFLELRQYEPALTFRIPANEVLRIDKALRTRDLLG
jgi:hypothetical protein